METISYSSHETIDFGKLFAANLKRGDIILLEGDLGAGKTHFVKGVSQGLGCNALVTSPTFTIMNIYEGGCMPIYHFDMYRLSAKEEAEELGFDEYFDKATLDGVSIVEWPSQVEGLFSLPYTVITISKIDDDTRKISVRREE